MRRTQLVLDLPSPGIRVVIVDDEDVVKVCLAMVLARFGALVTSGPATMDSEMIDAGAPRARLSEIATDAVAAFAVVRKLGEPSDENDTVEGDCELFLAHSTAAIALALSIMDLDALSN